MKEERGITLIALMIILVLIGIVIFLGLQYARNYMDNQKNEDIKATMLSIQGVVTNINNKHTVDSENNILVGVKVDLENDVAEYNITEEFKTILLSIENANLYILNQEELNNYGIKDVTVTSDEFYVVDYNSGEVFYSVGINGKYKLSEI